MGISAMSTLEEVDKRSVCKPNHQGKRQKKDREVHSEGNCYRQSR